MSDLVLIDVRDQIAVIALNRPEKLNALNYALVDRLMAGLAVVEADTAVRAVILTGSGDRAFSAGADIPEFAGSVAEGPDIAMRAFVRRGQTMTARIEAFPKPIIVAVNGLAYGGGCEITEAAHLAIASERAMFAKPEINLGMPPTFGGTQRLPRLAGRKRALQLLLTGDPFTPLTALQMGLINQVVPHGDLMEAAGEMARRILRHSPVALAAVLSAVTRGLNVSIAEGLAIEGEQFARVAVTSDLREGLDAWICRRAPVYDGRWGYDRQLSQSGKP